MKPPSRIALIGFMGSGKSTVGHLLADELGYMFVDSDQEIERTAGLPIAEIFRTRGESAFRTMETRTLARLSHLPRAVIAAGGGAPVSGDNRGFFSRGARSFHLRVSLETAMQRVGDDPGRPMLDRSPGELRSLYESRLPIYESLGTPVDTDGRDPRQVVGQIMSLLGIPRQ